MSSTPAARNHHNNKPEPRIIDIRGFFYHLIELIARRDRRSVSFTLNRETDDRNTCFTGDGSLEISDTFVFLSGFNARCT